MARGTLRSPKVADGPAFGHGALTFRGLYRAQFGGRGLAETGQEFRAPCGLDYSVLVPWTLDVPVENLHSVDHVEPKAMLRPVSLRR